MKRFLLAIVLAAMTTLACCAYESQPPTLDPPRLDIAQHEVYIPATAIDIQGVNVAPQQVFVPAVEYLAIQTPDSTDLLLPVIRCASHRFTPLDAGLLPSFGSRVWTPHIRTVALTYRGKY